jgi:Dyp-type peroxidase family
MRSQDEDQLAVDEIQGDILVGLQKDKQTFISFEIKDTAAFKRFLQLLAPRITTMRVALERELILQSLKTDRRGERFSFVGVTIAFTFDGLSTLGVPRVDTIKDPAFRAGLAQSSPSLNDPTSGPGSPEQWVVGGKGQALHGLLTVAGPTEPPTAGHADPVEAQVAFLKKLAGTSWNILREESGQVRDDARGHEHFGFKDGISQPAIRGRIDEAFPGRLFFHPGKNPNDPGQGLPGQDLIWPGEFVFGYRSESGRPDRKPSDNRFDGPSWMKNGSFLVYRRLRQLVPEFERFVDGQADALDLDGELLAARMVGRWKSGAPLVTTPLQDDPRLGNDELFNNAFEFSEDKDGRRCPFAAHIRKAYPRDDILPDARGDTEFEKREASEASAETRRIMRAGIPYGGAVSKDEQKSGKTKDAPEGDRGLMFVCYQTSIKEQFEFLTKFWINNPDFAISAAGEDPILGQAAGNRARHFAGARPNYPTGPRDAPIAVPSDFVVPTGGGYFFAPSMKALVDTIAGGKDPDARETAGEWGDVIDFPNVPVHTHLLPDGNVLFWGRREDATGGMDQHSCTPQIWDRNANPPTCRPTPQPKGKDGNTVNLFCSGHAFLPDGTLFVAGGHWQDRYGIDQACFYDWRANTWTPIDPMTHGRWYPSVTNLPDGTVLVTSGSYGSGDRIPNNRVPQIWDGHGWIEVEDKTLSLYPRMILLSKGRVFVAGTDPKAFILDAMDAGTWSDARPRDLGDRQYAPALMYAPDKVIFIGGGNDRDTPNAAPTPEIELIDFNTSMPAWIRGAPMNFPRRQHNATLLPDGTVLVTGGTSGPGFNDLRPGAPVHAAELWDPKANTWTLLAAEEKDRCYHSTAVLLPDATVLSAGGGEYGTHDVIDENGNKVPAIDPRDVHKNGQVFRPPYLFRGPSPIIEPGPDSAEYGSEFRLQHDVSSPEVRRLTALRLGSVTHAFDSNQRLVELTFEKKGGDITVTAPGDANLCPPGYYMVFALSELGVPSVAHIMRFGPDAGPRVPRKPMKAAAARRAKRAKKRAAAPRGTRVVVGLTSQCPYGLSACWGGAYQSLNRLSGVSLVTDEADAANSTAELWLTTTDVPDVARWLEEFQASANGSYDVRGFEVTVSGTVRRDAGRLTLDVGGRSIGLEPLGNDDKVQWDWDRKARAAVTADEAAAFARLEASVKPGKSAKATVTGPLRAGRGTPALAVRAVDIAAGGKNGGKAPKRK